MVCYLMAQSQIGHVTLVVIAGTATLVHYLKIKSTTTTTTTTSVYLGVPGRSTTSSMGATLWGVFQAFQLRLLFFLQFLLVLGGLLIWKSGTHRWNLVVPNLLMDGRDFIIWQGTRIAVPVMATGVINPIIRRFLNVRFMLHIRISTRYHLKSHFRER